VYLDLAIRVGVPLATVDENLSKAANAVGVPLYLGGPG
jgi:predicted nucleic acid-binding protein